MSQTQKQGRRVVFVVQGEGHGHFTQAMALFDILTQAGYTISGMLVGMKRRRELPKFFTKHSSVPIFRFTSPALLVDRHTKKISLWKTTLINALCLPWHLAQLPRLHRWIKRLQPDLIVNFHEPLIGLYTAWYRPKARMFCIAHQYLFLHKKFQAPSAHPWVQAIMRWFINLTSKGASLRLALSWYPLPPDHDQGIVVVPPLLRKGVYGQKVKDDGFLLIYLLNQGYGKTIIEWHTKHPSVRVHCFWDNKRVPSVWQYDDNLTFHQLDGETFLYYMAGCSLYLSTAGFESISEALYFGKPIMVGPIENHIEQYMNAFDLSTSHLGVATTRFDIEKLLEWMTQYSPEQNPDVFRVWVDSTPTKILSEIDSLI